jgi:hypothetical protein
MMTSHLNEVSVPQKSTHQSKKICASGLKLFSHNYLPATLENQMGK